MMAEKERKTLSKSILQMKFMKRSREKYIRDKDEEEGKAVFASEVTEAMRIVGNKFIIESSFVPCEGLIDGRLSYHGMNPEIEKLSQREKNETDKEGKEENDMEINDMEMARRYTSLIGTISNKFKNKKLKWSSADQPPEKRAKFMKPKDDD